MTNLTGAEHANPAQKAEPISTHSVAMLVFNPFVNDSRVLKEATSLSASYQVTVIAHGTSALPRYEHKQNFTVQRLARLDRGQKTRFIRKLMAYLQYGLQSALLAKNFDVIHCHDLNTLPIGVCAKLLSRGRSKLVYDAHEYEINHGFNDSAFKIRCQYWLEKSLIRFADTVITVSNSIANEYARLYQIPKPYLVLNAPPLQEVKKQNRLREALGIAEETTVFLYQGGLSHGRGIELILQAFTRLPEKAAVVFMGYGVLETHIRQYADQYPNIYYHPAVDPDILLDYTASADFGLSMIEDCCLSYRYCLPNKLFEYIMAGLPVIVSNLTEMRSFVTTHKVGIVTERNDADALIHAITTIQHSDMAPFRKNLEQTKQQFCWAQQEVKLLQAYQELM